MIDIEQAASRWLRARDEMCAAAVGTADWRRLLNELATAENDLAALARRIGDPVPLSVPEEAGRIRRLLQAYDRQKAFLLDALNSISVR